MKVQVVTYLAGRLLWISPALPCRAHDLTAARSHGIVPILADRAYMGAGPCVGVHHADARQAATSRQHSKPSTAHCRRHTHWSSGASHD